MILLIPDLRPVDLILFLTGSKISKLTSYVVYLILTRVSGFIISSTVIDWIRRESGFGRASESGFGRESERVSLDSAESESGFGQE